jgi:hypothetical protein
LKGKGKGPFVADVPDAAGKGLTGLPGQGKGKGRPEEEAGGTAPEEAAWEFIPRTPTPQHLRPPYVNMTPEFPPPGTPASPPPGTPGLPPALPKSAAPGVAAATGLPSSSAAGLPSGLPAAAPALPSSGDARPAVAPAAPALPSSGVAGTP